MATKLGSMMTNLAWLLLIVLLYLSVMLFCEITWQTKNITLLHEYRWPPNLAGWWLTLIRFYPSCDSVFSHMVLQDHVTNKKHISTTPVPMATKLGRMVTNLENLYPIMQLRSSVMRSRDKLKPLYFDYHGACGHQTWQDDNLEGLVPIMVLYPLVLWYWEII